MRINNINPVVSKQHFKAKFSSEFDAYVRRVAKGNYKNGSAKDIKNFEKDVSDMKKYLPNAEIDIETGHSEKCINYDDKRMEAVLFFEPVDQIVIRYGDKDLKCIVTGKSNEQYDECYGDLWEYKWFQRYPGYVPDKSDLSAFHNVFRDVVKKLQEIKETKEAEKTDPKEIEVQRKIDKLLKK